MKGLVIAIQFLTRLPMPRIAVADGDFARSMRCFPAVGLLIGVILAGAVALGAWIDPWTGALAALILWVAVTGALHLDGLGDIADACGAAHKGRDRLLAVLADPHAGSFAIVSIALQLIAKTLLLHGLIASGAIAALVAIPFAARIGPLVWTRLLPPLHAGLGMRFAGAVRGIDIAFWMALLLLAAFWFPALLAGPILMLLWAVWLRRKLGGISGDGHGAGIELVETGLLAALLVMGRLA